MEEFGGGIGKWGALGEMRRAAVEEPHRDQGQGRGALHIAKGPDGTKGFRVQRRKLNTEATGLETTKTTERSSTVFHVLFCGQQLLLTLTLLLGVSLTWLFPPLMAGS